MHLTDDYVKTVMPVKKILCLLAALLLLPGMFRVRGFSVSAKAAVVLNGDTGEVLTAKNADERLPMASTTKIMTAFLLCEAGGLDRTLPVSAEMVRVEGTSMGLMPGDIVSRRDLLYGMLLASGNDAANAAAVCLGGTAERFVGMMNEKAVSLGLANTHFVTPSGLDADGHYTTARELALLTRAALKNADFAAAAAAKSITLCYGNPPCRRTLVNHNRLLKSYDGLIGVKTGFTKKAGRCLVTAAKRDGKFVIVVTLNDPDDWRDHTALLDAGFSALRVIVCQPPADRLTLPVTGGRKNRLLLPLDPLAAAVSDTGEPVTCRILLPRFVYAPVRAGEQLGTVVYYRGGTEIKSAALRAPESVEAAGAGLPRRFFNCFFCLFSKI